MDKAKKKNIKRIIALVCTVAIVGVLAAMPLIAKKDPQTDGPQASILSGTAQSGSIRTQLIGGGTLTQEDAMTLSVPTAVKLKSFLVANGDAVTEGTAIASVDRVTVMTAITQVQETLETLSQQIEEAGDTEGEQTVSALAGGTVKLLYAKEGASVQSVMLEHGALAVLSLDGLMAVDLTTESTLSAGAAVTVTFEDGTAVSGKVAVNLAGSMTVTVEDDDYSVDAPVQVTADDGTALGSGSLYIYSPWNATAYTGTVDSIKAEEGDKLDAGDDLMVLSDVGYSAAWQQLVSRRQAYEELMLELFKMYQTETVTAPCDGVVSGVDEESLQLLSAQGTYTLSFLSNSPDGQEQTLYSNYLAQVTAVADNGWVMKVDPQALPVADYLELSNITVDTRTMTQTVLHTQTELPIFTLLEGKWVQAEESSVEVGDVLLFAADSEGSFVWCVLISKAQTGTATPDTPERPGGTDTPDQPDAPSGSDQPGTPTEPGGSDQSGTPGGSDQSRPGTQTGPGTQTAPGGSTAPNFSGGGMSGGNWSGTMPNGSTGSYPQGDMMQQEEEETLYGMDMTQIAAVTPQTAMTLDITVDEQDMAALKVGMEARIRIDALGGEKYTATITGMGNTGTNNGGSSKYTVTLTVDRAENMLSGMTATATVEIAATDGVLTVPADALVEQGNKTLIYTGFDEENEVLLDPVEVKVGVSDGETVEILEGLTEGQTYYYAYYDTLEISFAPDFGGMGMFGR